MPNISGQTYIRAFAIWPNKRLVPIWPALSGYAPLFLPVPIESIWVIPSLRSCKEVMITKCIDQIQYMLNAIESHVQLVLNN